MPSRTGKDRLPKKREPRADPLTHGGSRPSRTILRRRRRVQPVVPSPIENQAENDVFAAIRRELARAIATVAPRLSADQRDDVVQAATLRVIKIHQRSEGTRPFKASYLWRVAYSALIDEMRRRRRREQPMEHEQLDSTAAAIGNPEREFWGRQIGAAIQGCLRRLVRPRRLAVTLYLHGHGVPEAARLLGWKRKRAENLVYRGLADLRRCLDAKGVRP